MTQGVTKTQLKFPWEVVANAKSIAEPVFNSLAEPSVNILIEQTESSDLSEEDISISQPKYQAIICASFIFGNHVIPKSEIVCYIPWKYFNNRIEELHNWTTDMPGFIWITALTTTDESDFETQENIFRTDVMMLACNLDCIVNHIGYNIKWRSV